MRAKTLRDSGAIKNLIQFVRDDNRSLAQRAASALVKVGQEAVPELEKTLNEIEQDSRSWRLLDRALRQLAEA